MAVDQKRAARARGLLQQVAEASRDLQEAKRRLANLVLQARAEIVPLKTRTGVLSMREMNEKNVPYLTRTGTVGWKQSWAPEDRLYGVFGIFMEAKTDEEAAKRAALYVCGDL